MDDDLMSLRGGGSSRSSNDDDLFGSFTDPDDLGFDLSTPVGGSAEADEYDFSDPFSLPDFDQPTIMGTAAVPAQPAAPQAAATPARPQGGKPKRRARRQSKAGAFGMTPPQRMVLSIFLFLDVAVLGVLILFATGALNF